MNSIGGSMSRVEWSLLLILSILWGGSFFFVGLAVKYLPPFTIVAMRVGLAALLLHIILRAKGLRMPLDVGSWKDFFIMGLLNNAIPFSLLVWGQTQIASGLASILNATTPVFTIVVAHFLTRDEKINARRLAGILTGLLGVGIIMGPEALLHLGTNTLAQSAVLGASLSYAFAGVFGRRFQRNGMQPMITATGQLTASTVMLAPLALIIDRPWTLQAPGWAIWGAILCYAIFSTGVAYQLYFRILATAGATNVMLVTLLVPITAILLGNTILGEHLEPSQYLGMLVIALGLAIIDGRLLQYWRTDPADQLQ